MKQITFEDHAALCPHMTAIDEFYQPPITTPVTVAEYTSRIPVNEEFNPIFNLDKKKVLQSELRALYAYYGCEGPVEGVCPLQTKKESSNVRKPFAATANYLVGLITKGRKV